MNRKSVLLGAIAAVMIMAAGTAFGEGEDEDEEGGENFEIKMLDVGATGKMMVFEPAFVMVKPGDTITFVPTDKGHNAATIKGMIPPAAEPFKSRINEEFSVTLNETGIYGIRCVPHFGIGMVALIVVGTPEYVEDAEEDASEVVESMPAKAQQAFAKLFAQLKAAQ
ncbi:MAG: pseudoazurin [Devosia sp.]